jgi:hypothetical protein
MEHLFLDFYFRLVMKIYNLISRTKYNYLNAPEYIVRDKLKIRLLMFFHTIPTFVLSIILTVRILPLYSEDINKLLQNDSPKMLMYAIINWIIVSFTLGYLIEKFLELTKPNYKVLKEYEEYDTYE